MSTDQWKGWERAALALWLLLLAAVGVRVALEPTSHTVYPIFSSSARLWWQGGEVYDPHRPADVPTGFRYSPTFTILISPWAIMSDAVGGVLWRWFSAGVYLVCLLWWTRKASAGERASLLLLVIPLSLPSVNNGQANVLVTAMMLATMAAVVRERWNLATCFLGIAFVCKVYPLALGMVLAVLYPRAMVRRLVWMVLAALLLPFLCQRSEYVLDQYAKWIVSLLLDDRSGAPLGVMYRDLWYLVRLYGLPIAHHVYVLLQVAAGAAVAGVCWYRQRCGWPEEKLLTETLGLTAGWMLLLGPATESCTFILVAPSLAWAGLDLLQRPRPVWRLVLVLACSGLYLSPFLGGVLPESLRLHVRSLHPWATLLWLIVALTQRPIESSSTVRPWRFRLSPRQTDKTRSTNREVPEPCSSKP